MSQTSSLAPYIPTLETYPWGRPQEYCVEVIAIYQRSRVERLILLNAPVLPKKPMVMVSMPTDIENVKKIVKIANNIVSYIGHESTAKLLSELLGVEIPVSRAEYEPQVGDIAVVVRLKRRLQSPQDIKSVTIEDLEFYVIKYELDYVEVWQ